MKSLFSLVVEKFREEKGSISMFVMVLMIVLLPFGLWVGVQLPEKIQATYAVKQMAMNTADSIITRLDESALSQGHVRVDIDEAREIADLIIRETLNLDSEGNPSGKGVLKEPIQIHFLDGNDLIPVDESYNGQPTYTLPRDPGVYVYILNEPTPRYVYTEWRSDPVWIENTSVIVRANIPIQTFTEASRTMISKTGVSEATINHETGGEL